jgi:ribosomal protein L24
MSRLQTPIRRNDTVIITTGKDSGKRGRVLKVLPLKNRLIVEGVNMIKRHTRPNPQRNVKGGIVEREASLHASNVQLVCPRVQQDDAHRPQDPGRRPQGAYLPQVRGSGGQMNRLKDRYQKGRRAGAQERVRLQERDGIPKVEKVVVNMGLGEATTNAKLADVGADELSRITGQKAVIRRSTKSIAQFKLRAGMPVGAMVTLRGERMYEFLDRLISIALPASATSAGCRRRASTAAATTRSACATSCSSPRSTT